MNFLGLLWLISFYISGRLYVRSVSEQMNKFSNRPTITAKKDRNDSDDSREKEAKDDGDSEE